MIDLLDWSLRGEVDGEVRLAAVPTCNSRKQSQKGWLFKTSFKVPILKWGGRGNLKMDPGKKWNTSKNWPVFNEEFPLLPAVEDDVIQVKVTHRPGGLFHKSSFAYIGGQQTTQLLKEMAFLSFGLKSTNLVSYHQPTPWHTHLSPGSLQQAASRTPSVPSTLTFIHPIS